MSTVSLTLPSDGETIDASDVNNPFNTLAGAINGNLDSTNISSLSGTKLLAGTVPATALDASAAQGWNGLGYTFSSVTYNGNRSYSCVVSGQDLTSVVSPGTRLKTTRTTLAPTQATNLNGTTQYWSKTSPAGMTFTNNFVVSAWVKLSQYGAVSNIASRYNGTSGWQLKLEATGQVTLAGYNAGAGNVSYVLSYQAVPLNRWVHVTAQLDMLSFTASPTTSYIMIDGIDVPATVSRAGTNPTALVQAGNLEIGSWNGGLLPFPGKIAQVAIYNAKVTEATIQASIPQSLLGTETSLISAYSFNGNANDLNLTNVNNLSANGSAVATAADSPFGGQANGTISASLDYGIVVSATFSTNTTLVVQAPEGCAISTSGVSTVSYSTAKAPYGMPVSDNKWKLVYVYGTNGQFTSSTTYVQFNGAQMTLPQAPWHVSPTLAYQHTTQDSSLAVSVSTTSVSGSRMSSRQFSSAAATHLGSVSYQDDLDLTVSTPLYIIGKAASGTLTLRGYSDDAGAFTSIDALFNLV